MDKMETIPDFLYACSRWAKKKYAAQIARNEHQAPKMPVELTGETQDGHVMTWFLFQWVNPDTGITPAEEFARGLDVDVDWEDGVKHLTQLFFGVFRVLEMKGKAYGIVDSLTKSKLYPVTFRVGYAAVQANDVYMGYIHPWYDGTYHTIGTLVKMGTLPAGIITSGMANHLTQQLLEERQDRYESVTITDRTKVETYLKSQSADHVTKVAESLGIAGGTKKHKTGRIRDALTGEDITRAVQSLPESHLSCLATVATAGFMKRYVLERQLGDDESPIIDLYERGLLMLGKKSIGCRRHKIVAIPADVLKNLVDRGLLTPGQTRHKFHR